MLFKDDIWLSIHYESQICSTETLLICYFPWANVTAHLFKYLQVCVNERQKKVKLKPNRTHVFIGWLGFIHFVVVGVIMLYRKCDMFTLCFSYSLIEKGQLHFLQCKTKSFLLKGHRKLRRNVRHTDWPIQNIIKLALKRQHLHYEGERSDCILCAWVMQLVSIRPWDNLALQKMSVCGGCGWVGRDVVM